MNILHVIASMNPQLGGVVEAVRFTASGLQQQGLHNEVVALDAPGSSHPLPSNIKLHQLGKSRTAWQYHPYLALWLKENLPRFQCVIIHGLWLYCGYITRRLTAAHNRQHPHCPIRLLVMPHGMLDPYFQLSSDRKWKALRNKIYYRLVEHKMVEKADALLFTSTEEERLARIPFQPYRPKRTFITGLGIDAPPPRTASMDRAFAKACPELNNHPYLLFLGRLDSKKGIDLLIAAFARVCTQSPASTEPTHNESTRSAHEGPMHLVVAGPGLHTHYGQQLLELINQNPSIRHCVHFPGMLTGNAKWGAFYNCQAFVLCSHQENFGIAPLEAMACGKPVLLSQQVNIWRVIVDGGGGMAVAAKPAAIEHLLRRWADTPNESKYSMGQNAFATYQQHFTTARYLYQLKIIMGTETIAAPTFAS